MGDATGGREDEKNRDEVSVNRSVGFRFYWDDHCRFCNLVKRIAEALDWQKQVTFLALTSAPADTDLSFLSLEERMASSHLVSPSGAVYSRGEGILGLAQLLPLTAPLVFAYRLLPYNQKIADYLYRFVARNRGVPYGGSCAVDFKSESQAQE